HPDLHGAVGILFEQASSRGHYQDNSFGGIDFPFTIRNQFVTSLSTLEAVDSMRDDLSAWQREFYSTATRAAAELDYGAVVFGSSDDDPAQVAAMAELLVRHGIRIDRPTATLRMGTGGEVGPLTGYRVVLDQPQARLICSLFERRTAWDDNTFYDVSSWHLPSAFGVDALILTGDPKGSNGPSLTLEDLARRAPISRPSDAREVAWTLDWSQFQAPAALADLLDAGLRVRATTKPATTKILGEATEQGLGTIVIPLGIQDLDRQELRSRIASIETERGVAFGMVGSGLTPEGVDLGSSSVREVPAVNPLLVVGPGVSSYDAGEVWHYLDARLGLRVPMVEKDTLARMDLSDHTHLLLVSGANSGWSEATTDKLRDWVRGGGVIVATESAAVWASKDFLRAAEDDGDEDDDEEDESEESEEPLRYADYETLAAVDRIAGTTFEVTIDPTHPMCFGFPRERVRVFKTSTAELAEGNDPFAMPAHYTDKPLISGYASADNVEQIAGSVSLRAERYGSGAVVCLLDNPLFRGYWRGTERFYANALFFAPILKRTGPIDSAADEALESHQHEHGHGLAH
ncbi:MAG: hypothetical protein AAFZ65_11560, partial [Planctomycetota bacterium]